MLHHSANILSFEQLLIDNQAQAERLRQADARITYLESLLENQKNVYVMRAGFDQTYTYANRSFSQAFDIPGQAMVGRSLFSTMQPEDRPAVEAAGMAALQNVGQSFPVRIHKLIPGGGIIITDWELVAVTDADGVVIEIQGMGVDVTEKQRVMQDLNDNKNRLEHLLESIPNGFFALDKNGAISYANTEMGDLLGVQPHELLGKDLYSLLPASRRVPARAVFEQVMASREPMHYVAHWSETDLSLSVNVFPTPDGIATFFRNITAELQSERQVDKKNCQLTDIAWIQSHKVRAPLAHILGLIQIFNRTDISDPGNIEVLDLLEHSSKNLDMVIREIVLKAREV